MNEARNSIMVIAPWNSICHNEQQIFRRVSYNGSTLASQANSVGSIPITRSIRHA